MKILVVEDEPDNREELVRCLRENGYIVEEAMDGDEAFRLGSEFDYDAVILDPGLPRRNGLSVLRGWRKLGRNFPVIVVTGTYCETEDQLDLIDAGLNVYMDKPVNLPMLLRWLDNLITDPGRGTKIRVGKFCLDTRSKILSSDTRNIPLGTTEYNILHFMLAKHPEPVTSQAIADHCLGPDRGVDQVAVYISRLRREVGQGAIKNKRGTGYFIEG